MSLFNNSQMMGASNPSGYEIERSVRFDKTITDQAFDWTPSSDGNRKTWTFSCWLKRTKLPSGSTILSARLNTLMIYIRFLYDQFDMLRWNGASAAWQLRTNRYFRDTASWYHIVVAFDTTQGTASNRIKLYVNGSQETSFEIANYPNQNTDWHVNQSGYEQSIGYGSFDGYITEVNFIDGQALDASNFGETDSDTGQWIPKKFSGTYGSNGYFLNFADNSAATAAAIGKDSSGNSNNFTPDNVSVATTFAGDSFPDTPTNNMCVMNAIYNGNGNDSTIEKGGLHVDTASSSTDCLANIGIPQSGKWFFEAKMTELNSEGSSTGWIGVASSRPTSTSQPRVAYYGYTGDKWIDNTSSTYGNTYTANDVIGVAVNMDDSEITFYKNGTSQGTITSWRVTGNQYFFMVGDGGSAGSTEYELNFGQKDFLHSMPAGYKILTVKNIAALTIKDPTKYFEVMSWTGTGANQNYTLNHTSNIFWGKRTNSDSHWQNFDSTMGDGYALSLNNNYAKYTFGGHAFGTNQVTIPFSTSDYYSLSDSGDSYVGYSWKESSLSGVDIVEYSGTGSAQNISHSLNAAPEFIIVKRLDSTANGTAYVRNDRKILLNSTTGSNDDANYWDDTSPTSSVFRVGSDTDVNASGGTYRAYCFTSVTGFSQIGEYYGNGAADGTFVYTGFKPAFLLIRNILSTGNWGINDSTRDFNTEYGNDASLYLNLSDDETTSSSLNVDFLSNGFKLRSTNSHYNGSSDTYKYVAFAERPFKYANAE